MTNSSLSTWGSFVIKEKLKLLKAELRTWSQATLGNLDRNIEEKKEEIQRLDIIDDALGLKEDEIKHRELIMDDLLKESSPREAQL